jgi:hypothetical protein
MLSTCSCGTKHGSATVVKAYKPLQCSTDHYTKETLL